MFDPRVDELVDTFLKVGWGLQRNPETPAASAMLHCTTHASNGLARQTIDLVAENCVLRRIGELPA
jgi:hypothetical protein